MSIIGNFTGFIQAQLKRFALKASRMVTHLAEDPRNIVRYLFCHKRAINRAEYLRRAGDYPAVEKVLRPILKEQPNNRQALMVLAHTAENQGHYKKSAAMYLRLIESIRKLKNVNPAIALHAAEALRLSGNPQQASELILKFAPPDRYPESCWGLANCTYSDVGQRQEWINHFFMGQGLSPISAPEDECGHVRMAAAARNPVDKKPLISVVMSAYNMQNYLPTSIQSILDQSWRNLELVVVDDNSSDDTANVVLSTAALDSRIRLIRLPVNVGTYVCRNIGLNNCAGELVTVQDADDWCHPDRLQTQALDFLMEPRRIANICAHVRIDENRIFELRRNGRYSQPFCLPSIMIRKKLAVARYGYWDSVRVSADSEYWMRLSASSDSHTVKRLLQVMVFQLRREDSLTMHPETLAFDGVLSSARQAYHAAYEQWHRTSGSKNKTIPFPPKERLFPAPQSIQVPERSINAAISGARVFTNSG